MLVVNEIDVEKIMESSLIRLEYSTGTFVDGLGGTLSDIIRSANIPVKLLKVSFQTVPLLRQAPNRFV